MKNKIKNTGSINIKNIEEKEFRRFIRRLRHLDPQKYYQLKLYNEDIREKYFESKKRPNLKRVWKLLGLCVPYVILTNILYLIVSLFDLQLFLITHTILFVIMWETFIKPVWRELKR